MKSKHLGTSALTYVLLMSLASPAWAVQTHGGTEGLVVHQVAHLLFAVGMGYLLLRIYRIQMKTSGWFEFRVFLWLIVAWNLLTFFGHWLNEFVADSKFIQSDGETVAFSITSVEDTWFYLTRFDHLLLVPSFLFLFLALRKWVDQK